MQGGLVRPAFAVLSAGILESTVNTETEKDRFMSENTKNPAAEEFLPVCKADMLARGWRDVDFVLVTGDAYVDHPSFGAAIISRLLEAEGYRVGVLSQPDFTTCESMKEFGRPRYGFFIGGGNVDSMVAHYSVAKIRRAQDEYTPGGAAGKRPDRSATVYTQLAKQAYPDLPVILGGLEASLRRFAHYDYWLDDVLPSIVESSGADIVSFGMGERQTAEIARRLAAGEPVEESGVYRFEFQEDRVDYTVNYDRPPFFTFRIVDKAVNDMEILNMPEGFEVVSLFLGDEEIKVLDTGHVFLNRDGVYHVVMSSQDTGREYRLDLEKDTQAPQFTLDGVQGGVSTGTQVRMEYLSGDIDRAELYRDGVRDESFNGVTVSEPGNYQLFVYDKAGNMSSARFQMRYKMNLAAVMAIVLVILIAGAVVVYVKKVKRDVSVR